MSEVKMSDEIVLYCLQNLAGYEPSDIEDDCVEIAVNDDQLGEMSIVRTAQLGVELIEKQAEQIKMLREALTDLASAVFVNDRDFLKKSIMNASKALEATKD